LVFGSGTSTSNNNAAFGIESNEMAIGYNAFANYNNVKP